MLYCVVLDGSLRLNIKKVRGEEWTFLNSKHLGKAVEIEKIFEL